MRISKQYDPLMELAQLVFYRLKGCLDYNNSYWCFIIVAIDRVTEVKIRPWSVCPYGHR